MTPNTPLLCLIACSLALPATAQTRATTTGHTECRNVGATVTCTNVTPVPAADALRIFTTSVAPFRAGDEELPAFVPSEGSTYIGRIHGDVFSDQWPFESAAVYERLFGEHRVRSPRAFTPEWYGAWPTLDPIPRRWYR